MLFEFCNAGLIIMIFRALDPDCDLSVRLNALRLNAAWSEKERHTDRKLSQVTICGQTPVHLCVRAK